MKRKSLKDLQLEDLSEETQNSKGQALDSDVSAQVESKQPNEAILNNNSDIIIPKSDILKNKKEIAYNNKHKPNNNSEIRNRVSEIIYNKSDYIKMSITVDPDMFEKVDETQRQRRRKGEPYTYSEIIRDALRFYYASKGEGGKISQNKNILKKQ